MAYSSAEILILSERISEQYRALRRRAKALSSITVIVFLAGCGGSNELSARTDLPSASSIVPVTAPVSVPLPDTAPTTEANADGQSTAAASTELGATYDTAPKNLLRPFGLQTAPDGSVFFDAYRKDGPLYDVMRVGGKWETDPPVKLKLANFQFPPEWVDGATQQPLPEGNSYCWVGQTVFVESFPGQATKRIDVVINQDGTFVAKLSDTPWLQDPSRVREAPLWPELFPTVLELRGVCSNGTLWPTSASEPKSEVELTNLYLQIGFSEFTVGLSGPREINYIAVSHDDTVYTDALMRVENISRIPHDECPRIKGQNDFCWS
jgi:hypothetical protein